jgi:hypothetical protein
MTSDISCPQETKPIYEAKYDYVMMIEDEMMRRPKTKNFAVYANSGSYLGRIKWYANWRQYCFFPSEESVFSKGCMNDINDFITKQMVKQKKASKTIGEKRCPNSSTGKHFVIANGRCIKCMEFVE